MTSTFTYTNTVTFTRTHARYLASKIGSDLHQMQLYYGRPTEKEIEKYIEEVVILLLEDYLDSITYGFKIGEEWVIALKYNVYKNRMIEKDDRSGRVMPNVDITGASWYSFLCYNSSYYSLTDIEKNKIKNKLPIKRTNGVEPKASGTWNNEKSYSSGGINLQRLSYKRY